jgi:aminoglycoside 6'-N-acetyltransferase
VHVARWWHHETTDEALETDFGPSLDGTDSARLDVALAAARPFGFVQRYSYAENPGYLAEVGTIIEVPDGSFSIDYFVGEITMLRQGWGRAVIEAALAALWRAEPGATTVIVPVNRANIASRHVLEHVGFRLIAEGLLEPDNPIDGPEHAIYRIDRPSASLTD